MCKQGKRSCTISEVCYLVCHWLILLLNLEICKIHIHFMWMIEPLSFVSYGVQKFYNCMACCLCSDAHLPSKMIMYIKNPLFFRDSWSEGKWQLAIIDGELNCICWMRRKSGTTEAPGMCRPRTLRSWKECLCSSDLKQMVSIQSYLPKFSIYFFGSHNFRCFLWTITHSYQISSCLLLVRYIHMLSMENPDYVSLFVLNGVLI